MTVQYNTDPNIHGINGFGNHFSDLVFTSTLAAGVDTSLAVPLSAAIGLPTATVHNKWIAIFSYSRAVPASAVYVALNAAAAAPAGAPFALSTSEIEPTGKYVKSGDVIHFLCIAAANVSVAFYALLD